ncbi:peptidoglycan D,D-transpeptidase FtsI family protein [Pelosinus propionicus]|uniref:Penicillin-binding protein 2 n=1 Tax=Pelosinus propionicus DSM 13327 TaxID=1123291 RepID=A0A1I4KRL2_9FIRM|nr:penicillin-binding transpeptidase domain-containing protein [Pelosinus propionicus]SFL81452.1 penicillin-binding protein 2 [Pelosinus propionicus DSM 13327]
MALQILRIYKLLSFFLLFGSLLIIRLFYLQVIENDNFVLQSLSMRVQEVPIEVARGEIVDRNGLPLTNTAQHYKIAIFPGQIQNVEMVAEQLSELTGISVSNLLSQITENHRPFKIKSKIDAAMGEQINRALIPGVVVVSEKIRYGNPMAAHVKGYINLADNQGVSGIEGMYDDILRGNQPEYAVALVDAGQQIIPGLGYKRLRLSTHSGPSNVVLTIDKQIQKTIENIVDKHGVKGAVVVLRPTTGEILAMASRPNFNANHLEEYLNQSSAPLLNRAISPYQPGSVFKLVTAAAALEKENIQPDDLFFDPGYIEVDHLRFNGWDYDKGGRGQITFKEALAYSSNPIFIEVGLKIGAESLLSYAQKFGFGHKTSGDFNDEAEGYLPPSDNLYSGELANLAIGQGTLEATPLQIASLVATIANDGIKVAPYVISKLTNADGIVIKTYDTPPGIRVLSSKTALQIQDMMMGVTRYGTGQAAYVEGIGSAGKTGSAETGRKNSNGQSINHAWFAGYAPIKIPQYAVVVFVEEGMSGSDIAAPLFYEIIKEITKP